MILKLPEHVPLRTALAVGGLLAAAQAVEGTSFILVGLSFAFLILSVQALNLAGGMIYPSGTYVAMCAVLTVQLGLFAKAVLGQPLQRTLITPERTMLVYVAGMASMCAAAYVNKGLRQEKGLLERFSIEANATQIGVACFLVSHIVPLLLPPEYEGTFLQANYFLYLAILIPVFETVRTSGGRRSFNLIAFITWLDLTSNGLLTFSKQAIFIASACWIIAAVAAGYRTSITKVLLLGATGVVAVSILTPYSQVGRNYGRSLPFDQASTIAIDLLSHPLDLRAKYESTASEYLETEGYYHLFDQSEGILDRLNMFSVDDALVSVTDAGVTSTPLALWSYFGNLVPRYVYAGKPTLAWGNLYARQLGMISWDDTTTGISFSPFGDGYHCAQWLGVTVYSFAIFLFSFYMCDSMGGNTNKSIWALIYILYFLHGAPEGMLGAPVYAGGTLSIFVVFLAVTCSRVLPVVTNLVSTPAVKTMGRLGDDGTQVQSS